VSIFQYFAPL